jgi:polysaccharide export outer membrane protein
MSIFSFFTAKMVPFKKGLFFLLLFSFMCSCIPTRRVTYVSGVEDGAEFTVKDLNYRVAPGDRFYIQIVDPLANSALSGMESGSSSSQQTANLLNQSPSVHDYIVKEDGKIDYPLIGQIDAEGKTMEELRAEIYAKCKGYITNPSLKLYMTNYNVTVLGEANTPGFYQLITDAPTIFDAIGVANDLTDFANRKEVKLIRKSTNGVSVHYIDLTSTEFIQSPYFYIQPNDVIHIAPLKVKKFSSDNALPLVLSFITTLITIISVTSR